MSVRIEPAGASDVPAVLRLLEDAHLPVAGLVDHLANLIVARSDGALLGSAALELYADGALLRSVAVATGSQGAGIGHRLTEAALDLARACGVPAVYLLTTTADGFFPRFGFERIQRGDVPAGVRSSIEFRSACPASAIAMRRWLPGAPVSAA